MSSRTRLLVIVIVMATLCVVLLLVLLILTAPRHPVALIRVVDTAGKPVSGAILQPEGLRTKPGPYVSGWYGWRTSVHGAPNLPVQTDGDGYAAVPYPKHVFERIETGIIHFSVNHPEFAPDRPERVVATAPPAGAPWRVRLDDLWNRVRHRTMITRPDPVVLQKGAVLKLSGRPDAGTPKEARLLAQVSHTGSEDTNFWSAPEPGVLVTRRLGAGSHTVRAVQIDSNRAAWFSDVISITTIAGQTNDVVVDLKRGVSVRGQLDAAAPRPIRNGRVVANVWPLGHAPKDEPPQWHGWAAVRDDGSFEIGSLPPGDLEVVALCDGFVSTNGPGQFQMRYPQKHLLGTNDLAITIGMEPTARLEVQVTDEKGGPLKDARVMTWPNVRYGEWGASVLMSDCYNSSEWLISKETANLSALKQLVRDFEGVSDSTGLAVLPNLPATVSTLAVEHPRFGLPAVGTSGSGKRREASFKLIPGQTNRLSIQLEPRERSPITHY